MTSSLRIGAATLLLALAGCGGGREPAPPAGALLDAAASGNAVRVDELLARGAPVDEQDEEGRTPLMLAAFDGHEAAVRSLLAGGARVDFPDADGRTPLMYASTGPFAGTVELLLAAGADAGIAERTEGWTALMFAAGEGQRDVVEALLRHGAAADVCDADGDIAADHARARGHLELEQRLRTAAGDGLNPGE